MNEYNHFDYSLELETAVLKIENNIDKVLYIL